MSAKKGKDDINVPQFPSYRILKQDLKYFHPKCDATGKTHTDLKLQSHRCYISHSEHQDCHAVYIQSAPGNNLDIERVLQLKERLHACMHL